MKSPLNDEFFSNLRVIVSSHKYVYGPSETLVDFLISKRIRNLFVCFHPIPRVDKTWSMKDLSLIYEYNDGKLIYERTWRIAAPPVIEYAAHIILTCLSPLVRRKRFDIAIGGGLVDTLACIAIKKLGFVGSIVYYAHSFQPEAFHGFMRTLYYSLVRISLKESDWIWNLSERLARLHESLGARSLKNIVVPVGIDVRFLKMRDNHKPKGELIFVGHLKDDQGIKLVINAIPKLLKSYPNLRLLVIGGGPLFEWLKKFIDRTQLQQNVSLLGSLPFTEVMKILPQCDIGIAMYKPSFSSITKVTDPMKLKIYLAAGLPVITTTSPWLSSKIKSFKAGLVINYNEEEFIKAVIEIMNNYEFYHTNAVKLASYYRFWNSEEIFKKAIETIIRGKPE